MDPSVPRRVPLSLEELKRKRDESEAAKSKVLFVPQGLRSKSTVSSVAAANDAPGPQAFEKQLSFAPGSQKHLKRPRAASKAAGSQRAREESDAIRRHYMLEDGEASSGRAVSRQQHDKVRFRFEWDVEDDTNVDPEDSLYGMLQRKSFAGGSACRRRGAFEASNSMGHPRRGADGYNATGNDSRSFANARTGQVSPTVSSMEKHWSKKTREGMSERDWAIFREDNSIAVRGGGSESAKPARGWNETGLPEDILHLVGTVAGYLNPSPIQMAAIPIGLRGCDLIGLAETGSGKTAAFILPMLVHVRKMPPLTRDVAMLGPYVLILAPMRELVLQIESETKKFANPLGYRVMSVIGGQGLEEQGLRLQSGCEIVVCTPGRMVDLLSRRLAALGNCNYLILDEADRMIDMGFEPQVQEILDAMPGDVSAAPTDAKVAPNIGTKRFARRQTFMFSATMSPAIERLAREYLSKPTVVTVGDTGKAADAVDQRVEFLGSEGKKRERLVNLVGCLEPPVIVFVNTKKGCEDVARLIESGCGLRPLILHSGKSQEQREESLESFKSGRVGVLVATDVLGRGIDIKGVNHVVNFELPKVIASYTHRIGRTGRAGQKGVAWSLATAQDADLFGDLKAYLEQSGARVCPAIARFNGGRDLKPIVD